MKRVLVSAIALSLLALGACGKAPTAQEEVEKSMTKIYALTDEERSLAKANAKSFFEQNWKTNTGDDKKGQLINCRPTDSNKNGLVSCTGYKVNLKGELQEITVYAGYRPGLVGVSDQDTVVP